MARRGASRSARTASALWLGVPEAQRDCARYQQRCRVAGEDGELARREEHVRDAALRTGVGDLWDEVPAWQPPLDVVEPGPRQSPAEVVDQEKQPVSRGDGAGRVAQHRAEA